jgi:hypothetical protein
VHVRVHFIELVSVPPLRLLFSFLAKRNFALHRHTSVCSWSAESHRSNADTAVAGRGKGAKSPCFLRWGVLNGK